MSRFTLLIPALGRILSASMDTPESTSPPSPSSAAPSITDGVRAFEENCISPEMAAIYRQKTPTERLQIGFDMWRAARKLVAAGVRHQHPDWSDDEANREIARRMSHGLA